MSANIETELGCAPDGSKIYAYKIGDENLSCLVMNYGAICLKLIKNFDGKPVDITLGFSDIKDYFTNQPFFGAIVGRNANRIGGASFSLDGKKYILNDNDSGNNLHSGFDYYNTRCWKILDSKDEKNSISFGMDSEDGDQGYPNAIKMIVTYTISGNAFIIDYAAKAGGRTIWNPTFHGYFNLNGSSDILNHSFSIHSKKITYADRLSIPDGTFREVIGTPFDFTKPMKFSEHIIDDYDELNFAGGYDHNFVLEKPADLFSAKYSLPENNYSSELKVYEACTLQETNRYIKVYTDLPGLQLYTGNYIPEGTKGKYGEIYGRRKGVAMESQYCPNAINIPDFDQPVIDEKEIYRHRTVYEIGEN